MVINFDKRKSGIASVGDISWGTHFCQFYETRKDVLDVLVPYFKAGLENNELCLWVVSGPIGPAEAKKALEKAVPRFSKYADKEQIQIVSLSRWNTGRGKSGSAIVTSLDKAVAAGFDGLRLAGEAPPARGRAKTGRCYGTDTVSAHNVIAAFLYPRDKFDAIGLMEVVKNHRFALLRNAGKWEVLESSEAWTVKSALKRSEEKLHSLFSNMSEGFAYHRIVLDAEGKPCDFVFLEVNDAFEKVTGLKAKKIIGKKVTEALPGIEADPTDWIGKYGSVALTGKPAEFESYSQPLHRWYSVSAFSPHRGYFAVTLSDITERKKAEKELSTIARRFELLARTAGELLQPGEPKRVVDVLCREVMEHLDCHAFFNYLVDEEAEKLHLNAYGGIPAEEARRIEWLDYGGAVSGRVARDGSRIVAEKIQTAPDERTAHVRPYGIKAYACLPILGPSGRVTGTLSFGTCSRETFSEDDLSLMKAVTDQVAVAMIRMRDEQALRLARDEQEARVRERTAELARANEELEQEIATRRETERRVALTNELLKLYTRKFSRKEYLDVAAELIRNWSGCRHAGVRIAGSDGAVPFESCAGYNHDFLQLENNLSVNDDYCICTRVVSGKPEPSELMAMTPKGSFYSNQTLRFIAGLSEEQKGNYRSVCMRYGFRSLAVVPIRHRDAILGAIHVADEREGAVPLKNVEFFEQLAFIVGEALFRFGIEEELRQLNRELERRVNERTAQLETANRELEAFAYSVSHDLRTPLRSIDGFSHAILEDYEDRLDEAGKDFLKRIRAASGRMGELIDALLNLSRVTRGELNHVSIDLGAAARSIADELRKSEPSRTAEFIIEESVDVEADPVMLRVILENLLSNAWKFTGKREKARIEVGVVEFDGKPVYFVRDNGTGFDMRYAKKLFTAFQRLHGPDDFPGIGIGLATVQRIVHRHGGSIWAEGEEGKGATVYFTLA